ncbi:MAG TPA: proton-conducting transporter membrane subunit [Coriobacteriia bacterium]|nr:proton-conducting transporter membrane subunit [Coriobacteriia bacterium]
MYDWPHWLIVVIVAPLLGAALTPVVSLGDRRVAPWWALGVMTVTSVAAVMLVMRVSAEGPFSYLPGGWRPPYGIELRFDEFSASVIVICLIGWLAVLFSLRYIEWQPGMAKARVPYYYALLLLNLGGMNGFVVTGDLFNLFVFLEILSISSYALVAVSGERIAEMAAFKYLLMGAISSLLVLFAVGVILSVTGTLNMADVARQLTGSAHATPAVFALGMFTVGFMVKAALFPVHIWLPDAHAIAPSPVSAILSGLVVKMGIVGMVRLYQIYNTAGLIDLRALNEVLIWLGALSIVMGAFFAIFQDDIKLMLAYSTISNIGYIVMGLGLSTHYSVIGGVVHVFNHALIKAALFFAAGALIYRTGLRTLTALRGIGRTMPVTCFALSIGAISIVGIPPTAGFLCKWYIALGAFEADRPLFGFALIFGALFIFIYYIRMVNAFYFQQPTRPEVLEVSEAPASMLVPTVLLAALCLIMGILGRVPLAFIEPGATRLLAPLGG